MMSGLKPALSRVWRGLAAEFRSPAEDAVPYEEVVRVMEQASRPTLSFFLMLALATSIASFGLLANSAPAIIGAMIVAPLMSPIVSLAFGIVDFNIRLTARSVFSVATGAALVVGFSYLQTIGVGLRVAESEILNRTSPSLIDLGVAMAAGAAAAFAYSRRSIMNSIAGVAIAVALVPPLAVTGIGIAMGAGVTAGVGLSLGQHTGGVDIAKGSFTLFAANLVGIVGVAILVFITRRYGRWKPALVGLAAVLVLTGTLVEPLSAALNRMVVKSTALRLVAKLPQTHPELFPGTARLEAIDVRYIGGQLHIHLRGTLPEDFVPETQATLEAFQGVVSGAVGEEVFVQFEVTAVDTSLFRVGPRPNAPRGPTRSEPTNSLPEGTE